MFKSYRVRQIRKRNRKQEQQLQEDKEQLQEINMELKASYEQLAATTEQLNESEEKYKLLVENISDLVWRIDTEGKIVYINNQVENILGYGNEALIGQPLYHILCPMHKYDCKDIVEQMLVEDFDRRDLWMMVAGSPHRKILETNTKRIYMDRKLIGVQGLGRDVTEYVKIKKEIIKRNQELTLLSEISGVLTSNVSTVKVDDLLQTIVDKIIEMTRMSVCTIRMLNNQKLEFRATSGELGPLVSRDPLDIWQDELGRAVLEKRTIEIHEYHDQQTSSYINSIAAFKRLKHVIFIPLKLEDEVIGVMAMGGKKQLDQGYLNVLNVLSNHAAVVIEKARLYENLKQSYLKTIKALATAVEVKDAYTQGHSLRVSQYALNIGKYLGLSEVELEELEVAGILHDIGKIGINDTILMKPGKLTVEEYTKVKHHPLIGSKILEPIGFPPDVIQGILLHHKRYDLKGYPEEENLEDLPLYAKIIGVADAFDAMTSDRSYKKPMTIEEAEKELVRHSGSQFSPDIVQAMRQICTYHKAEVNRISRL